VIRHRPVGLAPASSDRATVLARARPFPSGRKARPRASPGRRPMRWCRRAV